MNNQTLLVDANFIRKYGNIPVGVFKLFSSSYVCLDLSKREANDYVVRNQLITMNVSSDWCDGVPLFHEMSHFALAKDNRLHLTNYGYVFPYLHPKRWDDLNCEIQVIAMENNLIKYYGMLNSAKPGNEAKIWDFLQGWENYRKSHYMTSRDMKVHTQERFEYWKTIYTADWFFKEWDRKNNLLKRRMKKYKTIIPQ